jgi:hypothetical protein
MIALTIMGNALPGGLFTIIRPESISRTIAHINTGATAMPKPVMTP